MNERELRKIFEAARREAPPQPTPDFPGGVMRSLPRREPRVEASLWDQLGMFLPRVATGTALLALLCLAGEWYQSAADANMVADASQIASQWSVAATPEILTSSIP